MNPVDQYDEADQKADNKNGPYFDERLRDKNRDSMFGTMLLNTTL